MPPKMSNAISATPCHIEFLEVRTRRACIWMKQIPTKRPRLSSRHNGTMAQRILNAVLTKECAKQTFLLHESAAYPHRQPAIVWLQLIFIYMYGWMHDSVEEYATYTLWSRWVKFRASAALLVYCWIADGYSSSTHVTVSPPPTAGRNNVQWKMHQIPAIVQILY